jgi:type I restriction enzyme S subunit
MSIPRYQAYKDSGVEWLGEVPSHWSVERLKRVSRVTPSNVDKKHVEGEQRVRLCNYTDVYYNDLITSDMEFMWATATPDQIEKFSLKAGQTIITKDSETADDIAISVFVPEDLPGVVCGYHLSIVTPHSRTHGPFLKWFFDSSFAKACFEVRANGLTRVGLSQYAVDNVELPFPTEAEQAAIASFLDHETAKIDVLVEEQKLLIELLKEKQQAVISDAVTKGLDPNAPMKDTGVEWLGKVPEHWSVVALKRLVNVTTSGPRGWSELAAEDGAVFFQSQNIGRSMEVVLDDAKRINPADDADSKRCRLQSNDVVVCITGARTASVAHIEHIAEPTYVNQHVLLNSSGAYLGTVSRLCAVFHLWATTVAARNVRAKAGSRFG